MRSTSLILVVCHNCIDRAIAKVVWAMCRGTQQVGIPRLDGYSDISESPQVGASLCLSIPYFFLSVQLLQIWRNKEIARGLMQCGHEHIIDIGLVTASSATPALLTLARAAEGSDSSHGLKDD
jgi:hypothetical protein